MTLQPLENLLSSRLRILVATFLTGVSGLMYQSVWHRYMGILLGAEARSSALVIAIFLLGLSGGFFFWGHFTRKIKSRTRLLKTYGLLEVLIGLWGILFPVLFLPTRALSIMLPLSFIADLGLTMLLIFPPTFLMGATIPLLTAILPSDETEVNCLHAKIYGHNTLGAFVGILLSGLVLIQAVGLIGTSIIAGILNILAAMLFFLNRLEGDIQAKKPLPWLENNFPRSSIYALVFMTGAVTISMELMWIRLWGLTVGASTLIFPLVVSVFVAGLALGSLCMGQISLNKLYRNLFSGLIILMLIFFTVPYFPLWVSLVRVSLTSSKADFFIFQLITYGMLFVTLFPFLFFLGRVLPLSYALLKKDLDDYGQQCGLLYFANTIGTFFGAVILSYFLLAWVDFDTIFKVNVGLLALVALFFFYRGKRFVLLALAGPLVLGFLAFASWNRTFHKEGIFRINTPSELHRHGPFFIPPTGYFENIFFDDGVTLTVSANKYTATNELAIFNNAKSDSSTTGDYSTLVLAGILPYFFLSKEKEVKAMVVGLATGVTAGLMGKFEDVSSVDVVEISDSMIKAAGLFADDNFHLTENPKVRLHEMDAFKFMQRTSDKYDLIVSEPTNPWTSGVENLFTPEFYQSVRDSLDDEGIFLQWMHLYEMDEKVFATVVKNLRSAFPDITLFYLTAEDDIAFINIPKGARFGKFAPRRFQEGVISLIMWKIGIPMLEAFEVLRSMLPAELHFITTYWQTYKHDLENPTISFHALLDFFTKSQVRTDQLIPRELSRKLRGEEPQKMAALPILYKGFSENSNYCERKNMAQRLGRVPFCPKVMDLILNYQRFTSGETLNLRMQGYAGLRRENFLAFDPGFISKVLGDIVEGGNQKNPAATEESLSLLFEQVMLEGQWNLLKTTTKTLRHKGMITPERQKELLKNADDLRRIDIIL
ncbi:MAG: hypothetical protein A2X86_13440 [Bdellovibrionales bacterium GWA2_49_15]|nr:MAG: hypothetical protein A2X86_13440 [Bdellovibrionales bacterium GWA2_49_15]HAZ13529.1 hypothetical protein [Bdellovibrionales bacterium]